MQLILDKAVLFRRVRFSLSALALGLCAITCFLEQAAFGQAQMGAAETVFDQGPDKLPAIPKVPIPALRAEIPVRIAQLVQLTHTAPMKNQTARPAHALSQDAHPRNSPILKKKAPEGTLTAAR